MAEQLAVGQTSNIRALAVNVVAITKLIIEFQRYDNGNQVKEIYLIDYQLTSHFIYSLKIRMHQYVDGGSTWQFIDHCRGD